MIKKSESEIMRKWKVKNTESPFVSVFCTAYNHENYIVQALDGFLMQETDFPFEVIVHDDVSSDGTVNIIKEYAKKFPSIIKPIYETENQYSKNDGSIDRIMYKKIKGKYIALCEGDDYWCDSSKIQLQTEALEAHPECSIAFCKVQFIEKDGRKRKETAPSKNFIKQEGVITLQDFTHEEFKKGRWSFHTSSFFFRKKLVSGYIKIMQNEFQIFPYGDMPLRLYCLLNGNGFYIDKIQSCYRLNSGGYTSFIKKNIGIAIEHQNKLICGLRNFDKLTDGKYHKDVEAGIRRAEFRIDVSERKIISVFRPKYWKEISIYMRLKMFIRICFPQIFNYLVTLKHPL